MESNIFLNGVPMIWVTVDETADGEWKAIKTDTPDYLIPADQFDGSVPADYWEREQ